ncbi:bromodomain-containing protein 4-like [Drosophila teissieri]|uniref:bromodomain-containing protein 4-like n=1 Tax=Drosophila teissieri TaxID=7243 RepID=UPI001CBA20ED|nr:bromodomain-containing protein 4-like [Drosophila teissieri]
MAARASSNNREVRETGTEEQPGAIWSRDSDTYLQLLASPLVSRYPSPVQEDPEEVPDMDLSEEETVAEGPIAYVPLSSESEDDDGGETVTTEVSADEDEGGRIARARMAYRNVRAPLPPTPPPPSQPPLPPTSTPPPPTPQQQEHPQPPTPVPQQQEQPKPPPLSQPQTPVPQSPLPPTPPAQPHPPPVPRTPTPPPAKPTPPPPRTPTPPPQDEEGPRCELQQSWDVDQAHVAQTLRTIGMGGRRWHQQTVTWTWPAPAEDTPESRVLEQVGEVGWMPVEHRARDPRTRVRTEDESPAENPEKGPWVWPAPPPPKLARQKSGPEARQPPQRSCLRRQASQNEKP